MTGGDRRAGTERTHRMARRTRSRPDRPPQRPLRRTTIVRPAAAVVLSPRRAGKRTLTRGFTDGASHNTGLLTQRYFDRGRQPVAMDIGPVLYLEDVVGGKVCALASRVEPRDSA